MTLKSQDVLKEKARGFLLFALPTRQYTTFIRRITGFDTSSGELDISGCQVKATPFDPTSCNNAPKNATHPIHIKYRVWTQPSHARVLVQNAVSHGHLL